MPKNLIHLIDQTRTRLLALALVAMVVGTASLLVALTAGAGTLETSAESDNTIMIASWPRDYESFGELLDSGEAVVVLGEVVEVSNSYPVGDGVPFTDAVVRVDDVLGGTLTVRSEELVIVRQTGGTLASGRHAEIEDARLLVAGERVLLFLAYEPMFKKYAIVGGPYGFFTVDGSEISHGNFTSPKADGSWHPLAAAVQGRSIAEVRSMIKEAVTLSELAR